MKLVIVSGMSGSGKSVALNVLEDLGYYCIDNLPLGLISAFAKQLSGDGYSQLDKFAIGIDARNVAEQLAQFPSILESLQQMGLQCETYFLQAQSESLIKRFSETRRKHPLSDEQTPLSEALQHEYRLLEPIHDSADLLIDTTHTNVHQLRDIIGNRVESKGARAMSILLLSFGFKHSIPSDADYIFDVRCLPNPHWVPGLRAHTGQDDDVKDYLEQHQSVDDMYQHINQFLLRWLPDFIADNRSYMTIAIGCTGGQHRSVYMTERLATSLRLHHPHLMIRHRELS